MPANSKYSTGFLESHLKTLGGMVRERPVLTVHDKGGQNVLAWFRPVFFTSLYAVKKKEKIHLASPLPKHMKSESARVDEDNDQIIFTQHGRKTWIEPRTKMDDTTAFGKTGPFPGTAFVFTELKLEDIPYAVNAIVSGKAVIDDEAKEYFKDILFAMKENKMKLKNTMLHRKVYDSLMQLFYRPKPEPGVKIYW
jgi:hypothetical protein